MRELASTVALGTLLSITVEGCGTMTAHDNFKNIMQLNDGRRMDDPLCEQRQTAGLAASQEPAAEWQHRSRI
jgi:hypothetical protein